MKNFTLQIFRLILTVSAFLLLFSGCISDRSLTQNDDFYYRRIVDKKDNKDYAFHPVRRHDSREILRKNNQVENNAIALTCKDVSSLAGLAEVSDEPSSTVDIASIDNKLFIAPVHQTLSKKINTLYQTNTDIASFRKGYKEIKKEQISKFVKANKIDDPKGEKAPAGNKPAMSIASFVLGIVGLIVAGLICGSLAIVFGIIGMKKGMKGLAIAGIVLGIIDVVAAIIILASA